MRETSERYVTFWDHLDELRVTLIRALAVMALCAVLAFCMKDWLFQIVLAPRNSDFPIYKLLGVEPFSVGLMNTGLTEQFMIHLKVSLYAGVIMSSPFILYELFRFVAPGLYANERRWTVWLVGAAYLMFLVGTFLNYELIFPLALRFLATYQVSADVANMLTLQSYVDTLIGMSLVMGVVFELPVACWLMGRMGLLTASFMKEYRRHAVVVILVIAAVFTPTTDAFTLSIVAFPIWLLYEVSIWLVWCTRESQ